MAEDENSGSIFGNESLIGGGRRRGGRSDTDALPGSSENSKRYDRLYNPQGENEYTNLPENANQLEEANFLRRRNEYVRGLRSELKDAMKRVQFWPQAGRFVIPKQNTFAAHLALVREGNTVDIHFDPDTYLYFDKVIAQKANRPELFNPNHRDFAKYENLRENLAVLRNDIMGIYMDDGSFDPGDEKFLPRLVQIANDIGDALNVGNGPRQVLFTSLDKDIVNIEGEGAAHIYNMLLEHQTPIGMVGKIKGVLLRSFGQPDREWKLPPLEQTPFSNEGLSAPAQRDELCNCSNTELKSRCADLAQEQLQIMPDASREDVASITSGERREAVEHGHKILDWLRNIQFSDKSLMDFVDTGNPTQTQPEVDAMNMMIDAYYSIAETAFRMQPELFSHPKIQAANEALESLEHGIALMAKLEKPKSLADTMQISADVTQQPDKWNELAGQTVDRLMQTLKGGLEEAVGAMDAQQQDVEQQQEESADRQVDLALANHAAFAKGRRKRKKQASGQGATKQKKTDLAFKADDYARGEGVHAGRRDISRDGIVDSLQKPDVLARAAAAQQAVKASSGGIDAQLAQMKMQPQELGAPPLGPPSQIDPALVKQLGKAMLQMQRDSDAAAASLPPEIMNAVKEQTNAQRASESKNNPKRPRIG